MQSALQEEEAAALAAVLAAVLLIVSTKFMCMCEHKCCEGEFE